MVLPFIYHRSAMARLTATIYMSRHSCDRSIVLRQVHFGLHQYVNSSCSYELTNCRHPLPCPQGQGRATSLYCTQVHLPHIAISRRLGLAERPEGMHLLRGQHPYRQQFLPAHAPFLLAARPPWEPAVAVTFSERVTCNMRPGPGSASITLYKHHCGVSILVEATTLFVTHRLHRGAGGSCHECNHRPLAWHTVVAAVAPLATVL